MCWKEVRVIGRLIHPGCTNSTECLTCSCSQCSLSSSFIFKSRYEIYLFSYWFYLQSHMTNTNDCRTQYALKFSFVHTVFQQQLKHSSRSMQCLLDLPINTLARGNFIAAVAHDFFNLFRTKSSN